MSGPCKTLSSLARIRILTLLLVGLLIAPMALGQDLLSQFEEKTTSFTLDNGLTFVVVERPEAPVVSFHTHADVGAVDEPAGQTGISHMVEHMAFKGTTSIGTKDIEAEMEALDRLEEIALELREEQLKRHLADEQRIAELEEQLEQAQEEAEAYIEAGEFENILEREGVSGLNAFAAADETGYLYSLPANKLELFFATESDRFHNPVFREFYTEREIVKEERRQRVDDNPIGRLQEDFLSTAFKAHPYGDPTIGFMSDLEHVSRTDARAFFDTYYQASNLTIGIAGDVDPEEVQRLAEEYFGRMESGEAPTPVRTEEPEQLGERRVTIVEPTQPFLFLGYHRPSMHHDDDPVFSVLQDVLSQGRTSRLYQNLVEEELAAQAQVAPSFPGNKYSSLFMIVGVPSQGVSPEEVEEEIYAQLERIKEDGITEEELERAKTRARSNLINGLDSNSGLARRFAQRQALTGDWRDIFRELEELEAVTADDVQRVAQETFEPSNRTVAMIKTEEDEEPTAAADAEQTDAE